jgi:hypothetical protein
MRHAADGVLPSFFSSEPLLALSASAANVSPAIVAERYAPNRLEVMSILTYPLVFATPANQLFSKTAVAGHAAACTILASDHAIVMTDTSVVIEVATKHTPITE